MYVIAMYLNNVFVRTLSSLQQKVPGFITCMRVLVFSPIVHTYCCILQYGFVPHLRDSMFVKVKIQHRTQPHVCLRGFICPCK